MRNTQELIQLLRSLKATEFSSDLDYLKKNWLVDKVLETIFKIQITNTKLSASEEKIVGPLLADSLCSIGGWVSYSVDELEEAFIDNYKIARSGLEFLFETYQELPDGRNSCLGEAFKAFKAEEDIESWDEQFRNVSKLYDPNFFYKTTDKPTLNFREELQVPTTHWWWGFNSNRSE